MISISVPVLLGIPTDWGDTSSGKRKFNRFWGDLKTFKILTGADFFYK